MISPTVTTSCTVYGEYGSLTRACCPWGASQGGARTGGSGGLNMATWGDLTNAGGAMPPPAGPSEAALIAQRRLTAPGGQYGSDQEELYGRGYGRRGGRLPPSGPHSRRATGGGRPSGDGGGINRRSSSGAGVRCKRAFIAVSHLRYTGNTAFECGMSRAVCPAEVLTVDTAVANHSQQACPRWAA